jgi:hypothetical protein
LAKRGIRASRTLTCTITRMSHAPANYRVLVFKWPWMAHLLTMDSSIIMGFSVVWVLVLAHDYMATNWAHDSMAIQLAAKAD